MIEQVFNIINCTLDLNCQSPVDTRETAPFNHLFHA